MGFMFIGIVVVIVAGSAGTSSISRPCRGCGENDSRDLMISRRIVEKEVTLNRKQGAESVEKDEKTKKPIIRKEESKRSKFKLHPFMMRNSKCALIDEDSECAICWGDYEDGETVCYSPNKRCVHVFHSKCLKPWLKKRNDCPLCKYNIISSWLWIRFMKQTNRINFNTGRENYLKVQ